MILEPISSDQMSGGKIAESTNSNRFLLNLEIKTQSYSTNIEGEQMRFRGFSVAAFSIAPSGAEPESLNLKPSTLNPKPYIVPHIIPYITPLLWSICGQQVDKCESFGCRSRFVTIGHIAHWQSKADSAS